MKKKDKDLKTESKLMRALREELEEDIRGLDLNLKRWIMKANALIGILERRQKKQSRSQHRN